LTTSQPSPRRSHSKEPDQRCSAAKVARPCVPPAARSTKAAVKKPSSLYAYRATPVHPRIKPSLALLKLLKPFQEKLREKMSNIVGSVNKPHFRARPESMLGNLVAEMNLSYMRRKKYRVDVFLTNLRGIRRDMPAGVVTMGDLFEILPFENELVILKTTGKQLLEILHGLCKRGGEPIAGATLWMDAKRKQAHHVRIAGKALRLKKTYFLGTSRYLAKTGWMSRYTKGIPMQLTPLMIRDGVIKGFKNKRLRTKGTLTRRIQLKSMR
jgi:2',3'-cyclic-nucleotide 2'-phosphodiesterase (5'-nucleotidase family)